VIAVIIAAVLFVGLIILTSWNLLLCWFLSWTLVTFAFYGFDKLQAKSQRLRVPEFCLFALAVVGGVLGAIGGMLVFRHKTTKLTFWIVNLVSLAAYTVLYIRYFR
jgi:uncharacterized membrane protein YsdA (DUF1294 family)